MALCVVEYHHEPPLSDDAFDEASRNLKPCIEQRNLTWRATYLSKDRRNQFCVFETPDAETLRDAFRTAGVAFERIWPADSWIA